TASSLLGRRRSPLEPTGFRRGPSISAELRSDAQGGALCPVFGVYPGLGEACQAVCCQGVTARILISACLVCAALHAQVAITGRVVDENGAPVGGALVEFRAADGARVAASSDPAGNFQASLAAAQFPRLVR